MKLRRKEEGYSDPSGLLSNVKSCRTGLLVRQTTRYDKRQLIVNASLKLVEIKTERMVIGPDLKV